MIKPKNIALLLSLIFTGLVLQGCSESDDSNITQWKTPKNCDLHSSSCIATMGNSKVMLKISPHPIPIARPLGIEVNTKNIDAQKMKLDISGINMYMGYNRVDLTPMGHNRFVGTSMLAFCTNHKMEWQITLMIYLKDGKQIQIPYTLETVNRR